MNAFFAMGGYGAYVWASYAASLLVVGLAVLLSLAAHARALAEVRRLEGEEEGGAP